MAERFWAAVARWRHQARRRIAQRWALIALLWRAARWRLVVVGVLTVLQGLAPTAAILATGLLVAAVPGALAAGVESAAGGQALFALALFGGALLLGAVLTAVVDYQVHVLNGRYGWAVHTTVAEATLRTPGIAVLEGEQVAGDLAALEELERVDGFVLTVTQLRELVQRRATGVGAFVVLLLFAWWAPLVMVLAWRGLSFGIRRWIEQGVELGATIAAARMRRPRYLRELAMGPAAAKEVRIFGLADWLVRSYVESYQAALHQIWRGRKLGMRTVLVATGGVLLAHALVFGVMGGQAAAGVLTVAQLVVFVQAVLASNALGFIGEPELAIGRARQVAWRASSLRRRLAAAVTSDVTPDARATGGPGRRVAPAANHPLRVHLAGVRFTYPGREEPALDWLDLSIEPGESVAIVGENGAGKSTLIKLLCGLYQPAAGTITISGVAPQEIRHRIGVIFQNFVRYELTLRENVSFGSPALAGDERELAAALTDAGAGDLLTRLPAGWDTVLSASYPGGRDLSGGQWQKVALARAFAAVRGGAGLLILDEPAASLDVRAEADLFRRFLEVTRGVTTVLVTHRLAAVRRVDRIVLISGGRVVEDGPHARLMAAGGRYAGMYALQARRFARNAPAPVPGPVQRSEVASV